VVRVGKKVRKKNISKKWYCRIEFSRKDRIRSIQSLGKALLFTQIIRHMKVKLKKVFHVVQELKPGRMTTLNKINIKYTKEIGSMAKWKGWVNLL
jgi:hypothetical protein